jgi:hypothetical protein
VDTRRARAAVSHAPLHARGIRAALLAVSIVGGTACGNENRVQAARRTDSAGVEIVSSSARDVPLEWTTVRLRNLLADRETGVVFPQGVAAGSDGRVYVINDRRSVLVLDTLGALLGEWGRPGPGPGEFRGAAALALDLDGNLYVADIPKRLFVRFTRSGAPLDEVPLPRAFRGGPFQIGSKGYVLAVSAPDRARNLESERLLHVTGADTASLVEITDPPRQGVAYKSCPDLLSAPGMPPIFSPAIRWAGTARDVFVATRAEYAIDRFSDGRLAARWRRPLVPTPATHALATAQLGEGTRWSYAGGQCRVAPAEEIAARGIAPVVPTIESISHDATGGLWVRRKLAGGLGPVDVFSQTGDYLGTLPPETPTPLQFISADTFLSLGKDSLDVAELVLYRVNRTRAR